MTVRSLLIFLPKIEVFRKKQFFALNSFISGPLGTKVVLDFHK